MTQRRLQGSLTFSGRDDETNLGVLGGGDVWKKGVRKSFTVLLAEGASWKHSDSLKWGGECRLEADFTATCTDGRVHLHLYGRLYEGKSENTTDLEDSKGPVHLIVGRSQSGSVKIHLRNHEAGSDDEGWITLDATNLLVEEP